ncbi:chitin deacetylase 8-like [Aphomia sociella]
MKWALVLFALFVAVVADELPLAEPCDPEQCQLPDCRCSSQSIPRGLAPRDTPQFVMLTFDDGVNVLNIETYRELLFGKRNKNGCPIGTTFYVNHEYTSYQVANTLYNQGFEIALHSITHQTPQSYWAEATKEVLMREFADQRIQMSHFANIPYDEIKGVRIPFLQLAGNASYDMLAEAGLVYDSTWATTSFTNPGLWPYTLDYASIQDCVSPPCPNATIPGVWVLPLVSWTDLNGSPCAMADSCFYTPDMNDENAWFRFILTNFERSYLGNRAPFGFYLHEWYLTAHPAVRRAYERFLDLVLNLEDVFVVNSGEVIEWVKDPIPLAEYIEKPCRSFTATSCPAVSCGPLDAEHTEVQYWMQICNVCPRVYPWLNNPLGQ